MDKSTPRPWKRNQWGKIVGPDGHDIVLKDFSLGMGENDEAADNAAAVFRAVNRDAAFDALVEALRPFADLGVGSGPDEQMDQYRIGYREIRAARAALALAKETP